MKIYYELDLKNFDAWSGGKTTLDELTSDEIDTIQSYLEDLEEEMEETELNDFLWFEDKTIANWLGYSSWEALENVHKYGDEVNVCIFNIKWDIDEDEEEDEGAVNLPSEIQNRFDYNGGNETLEDDVSEWLSDEYGFCHNGFEFKIMEEK